MMVLNAVRYQRAGGGGNDLLAEPRHCPVEVVQLQPIDALDPVINHPFLAAAIGARDEQPMQDAGEDGALDGKLKTAARDQLAQHLGNAEPLFRARSSGDQRTDVLCVTHGALRRPSTMASRVSANTSAFNTAD